MANTGRTHFKRGSIPWNKGKNLGKKPAHSAKMRKAWSVGKFKSREIDYSKTAKKISATQQGIGYGEWEDFTSPLLRRLRSEAKYIIWRKAVFLRDNFTCQNPNCKFCNNKIGVFLHAHHIKHFSSHPDLRLNLDNGITYCAEYHLKSNLHLIKTERGKDIMEKINTIENVC